MPTAGELRTRFRALPKEARDSNQSFSIRVWRGLSWLERAEGFEVADIEGRFITGWIGLNALYGRQDDQHHPWGDREALGTFLAQVWRLDTRGLLRQVLGRRQTAVLNLIDDRYLTLQLWEGKAAQAVRQVKKEVKEAILVYSRQERLPVLRLLFDRLYVMRNQVFHGASTKGSKLNRRALQASATVLSDLLPSFLEIMIDAGVDRDWGKVCFPPEVEGKPTSG